jgi:hypothetical protein
MVNVFGALGPCSMYWIGSDEAVPWVLGVAVLVDLSCCAGWIVLGRRHLYKTRSRLAKVIPYACAFLSLGAGAFWAWLAYMWLYVLPYAG